MKKLFRISLLMVAIIALQFGKAEAQKFGYVNSQEILATLPDVKQMQANLEDLGSALQKKGEQMLTSYKQKEEAAILKKERGELAPAAEQTLLEELQVEQKKIVDFEKDMQQKLYEKEQELTLPIKEKINKAITDVAAENGYTMIFESGVLLYADDTISAFFVGI